MKAVAYQTPGPIDREDALQNITLDKPVAEGRDLLVKVEAVSVNPADTKMRMNMPAPEGAYTVLGFDASGVVESVGADVSGFEVGDEVYYSGSMSRAGTNSEFHLVDERIVGRKPASVGHAAAAALPLTTLTAWEALFDRLDVRRATVQGANTILVVGGAGGVGSITIQLLRALTGMNIIATASRPETQEWVRALGAHHVIDHRQPMAPQIAALGLEAPGFVFSTNQTEKHLPDIAELIAPQGRFSMTDEIGAFISQPFVMKAVSLHFELMFTRSFFQTPDMDEQGKLLTEVAKLVDAGKVRSTLTEVAGKIDAATMRRVHAQIETGKARGKIVLEGF